MSEITFLVVEKTKQRIDEGVPMLPPISAFYRQHPKQLDFFVKRLATLNLNGFVSIVASFHKVNISTRREGESS